MSAAVKAAQVHEAGKKITLPNGIRLAQTLS